ncbi:MAG: copper chaperone PCu(A)C [Gammaproteobacteria bacterium]|jgi:copper(I)-binding protein
MKLSIEKCLLFIFATLMSYGVLAGNTLEIDDAWIAEAPPVSKVMAAYLKIENETERERQATAMQCEEFERAEFHQTVEKDGMARMAHQQTLKIPADSELELKPGGYHIMLFNPARRLQAGDQTNCKMSFDDGSTISFTLKIKKSSVDDHSHHHHH